MSYLYGKKIDLIFRSAIFDLIRFSIIGKDSDYIFDPIFSNFLI